MISRKHKFIFIHINKTGGTTINSILAKYAEMRHFTQHQTYTDLKKRYGSDHLSKFYIFSFFRNPWQRMVSLYFYRIKKNYISSDIKFREFVKFVCRSSAFQNDTQISWVSEDGKKPLIDFIGKTENLQSDFNTICNKIGIPQKQLPVLNKTTHKPYWEYYDDETREMVEKHYEADINYFNYKFGE